MARDRASRSTESRGGALASRNRVRHSPSATTISSTSEPPASLRDFFAERKVFLAPMAGVSDAVFRSICLAQGADLAYTEMVSAKGLSYRNARTQDLLERALGEDLVAVQLFGHEPQTLAVQAAWVEEELGTHLAYLDINMGCPARKIVSKGDGAALMKDPELAAQIVSAVSRAVKHPVTVKFRRGWSEGEECAPDFARRMEDAGAAALTVHGRYAMQYYRGSADWGVIARVVEAVSVPVIGNGDITDGSTALRMLSETDCSALMIARGAQGNPWIFADVAAVLAGKKRPPAPGIAERLSMIHHHARLLAEQDASSGSHSLVRMRKHAMWYTAGLPHAASARRAFSSCSSLADFDAVLRELARACAIDAPDFSAEIEAPDFLRAIDPTDRSSETT